MGSSLHSKKKTSLGSAAAEPTGNPFPSSASSPLDRDQIQPPAFFGRTNVLASPAKSRPAGYAGLFAELGITSHVPQHQTMVSGSLFGGRTQVPEIDGHGRILETVPGRTAWDPSPGGNLLFALKHDGVDLEALRLVFAKIDNKEIQRVVREQPGSEYARRLWFLYEWMTEKTIDAPEQSKRANVLLLNPDQYVTCEQGRSPRHGLVVNCLGGAGLCPTIRMTPELRAQMKQNPFKRVDRMVSEMDATTLQRINKYLLTRESKGTFEIEGITPQLKDDQVFFALLTRICQRPLPLIDPKMLHEYQNLLVLGSDQERSGTYRKDQVWIGDRKGEHPIPEYIAPQAPDVPRYMDSFCQTANWLTNAAQEGQIDPIVAGAANSGMFVYIHPFMDGNGRLSRLILQQALSRDPTPEGKPLLIPISSAIHRQQKEYYGALDVWSSQVMKNIRFTARNGGVFPDHPTGDLYRYPDLTKYTEFIYRAANEAVSIDIKEEQRVLEIFDRVSPIMQKFGLDDKQQGRFFQFLKQNNWSLSKRKRALFPNLSEQQLKLLEQKARSNKENI